MSLAWFKFLNKRMSACFWSPCIVRCFWILKVYNNISKGSRSVFGAKWFCWGPGVPRPKTTHFEETSGSLALPPSAARPTNHYFLKKCAVWWPSLSVYSTSTSGQRLATCTLGRIYGRILDFSCGARTEHGHEMAL